MKHHSRWRAATVVLAAALPLVLLSGDLRAAVITEPNPVTIAAGYLAFEVGPNGARVAEYDGAGNLVPGGTVDLSLAGCRVTNSAALPLAVSARPLDPDMFLVDNGIGFRTTSGNCSKSNGRVSYGETLVLQAPAGREFRAARLNVEGKFSADLKYVIGDTPLGAAAVRNGGTFVDLQSDTGDNGPDSGTSDNTVFDIDTGTSFTTISLTPVSDTRGQIALDNGGDSSDPDSRESRFYFGRTYDFGVDCGDEVFLNTFTNSTLESVTFRRGSNKTSTCELIGLDIDSIVEVVPGEGNRDGVSIDPASVSVLGNPQDVRARVEITWVVPRRDALGALRSAQDIDAELARQIQYPGFAAQSLSYCASADLAVGAGATPDLMNVADYDVISPDDQPVEPAWCLLSDERVLEGDTIVQTIVLDVGGDPKFF